MIVDKNTKIGDIVAKNFKTVEVFEKFGLDFCCGGKKSIDEACSEKGIEVNKVVETLGQVSNGTENANHNFAQWEPDFLIDYIINVHHTYVNDSVPRIFEHSKKVASVHGERHPEAKEIFSLFNDVKDELASHMMKEEKVLFPYIKKISEISKNGGVTNHPPFGSVNNPIKMMEMEHESAGAALARIREISNNLTPPEDACGTYRVLYQELDEFEKDLHRHIHLENNILFPKAINIENNLKFE